MEERENSGVTFDGSYKRMIYQDDFSEDDQTLSSYPEKQQVSMLMVRPESSLNHHQRLTAGLAVLAVVLLAVDVGLGVYYNKLTDGQMVTDISSEVAKLQASYDTIIQSRDEAKKQLAKEISEQQMTKWEIAHQSTRTEYYEKMDDQIHIDISALRSHIPMLKEGCRHCLPGWTFMNSVCYYFAFSEDILPRSWDDAREFCKIQGGDLAVINSRENHLAITRLISGYKDPQSTGSTDFWIGLTDTEQEGTWKWLDGTRLTEGYWIDGEPNNQGNEDCVATFPKSNPFQAWNDAPCSYHLKWICQRPPRSTN
ncbi:C-type lectin domain family 4 member M-like [Pseudoliparis swirei]|uniref:C-type lectin domain family 4 member M-like n=1 Tax=Pseudoliparis swirei TaxID=2059687 RepID=UPI0024BDC17F|nr:C-type lectin domain family 4 member M-like [Pseudoliparis swirei]